MAYVFVFCHSRVGSGACEPEGTLYNGGIFIYTDFVDAASLPQVSWPE